MQDAVDWEGALLSSSDMMPFPTDFHGAALDLLGADDSAFVLPELPSLEECHHSFGSTSSSSPPVDPARTAPALPPAAKTPTPQRARTAQQKYRERQKARLQDSEDQITALERELHTMQIRQESLTMRNLLLEKLLVMPQASPAGGQPAAAATAQGDAAAARATTAKAAGDFDAWWLDAPTRRLWEDVLEVGPSMTFTLGPGPPMTLPRAEVEEMPVEVYVSLSGRYVSAFADALLKVQRDDRSLPGYDSLERLVLECWQLHTVVGMKHPERKNAKQQPAREAGTPSSDDICEADAPQLLAWLHCVRLQPVQVTTLLKLRKLYLHSQGHLEARRIRLSRAVEHGNTLDVKGLDKVVNATEELARTLREEHCLVVQFMIGTWRQALTPFQAATLMMQAHPKTADMFSMLDVLAAEHGEPDRVQLLAEGASQPAGALAPLLGVLGMINRLTGGIPGLMGPGGEPLLPDGCLVAHMQRSEAASAT